MEDNRKKIRIDEQTKSITIVKGNRYFCAIDVNQNFMDTAMTLDSIHALENLFKQQTSYEFRNY